MRSELLRSGESGNKCRPWGNAIGGARGGGGGGERLLHDHSTMMQLV